MSSTCQFPRWFTVDSETRSRTLETAKTLMCIMALVGFVGHASGQSLVRVQGSFLTVAIADSGGWMTKHPTCLEGCSGRDSKCDSTWGWASSSASATDEDWESGPDCCVAVPDPTCASGGVIFSSESSTVKKIVWTPRLFGRTANAPPDPLAVGGAYAFNDLVLRVNDSNNPTGRYRVEVLLLVGAEAIGDIAPVYVEVGGTGLFALSVDVGLDEGTVTLDSDYGCAEDEIVSNWVETDPRFYAVSLGAGCHELLKDGAGGWTSLGTVCEGTNFRLGFRMMAEGVYSFQTHGTDDTCGGPANCDESSPLELTLYVRIVTDGGC